MDNAVEANLLACTVPGAVGEVINIATGQRQTLNRTLVLLREMIVTVQELLRHGEFPLDHSEPNANVRMVGIENILAVPIQGRLLIQKPLMGAQQVREKFLRLRGDGSRLAGNDRHAGKVLLHMIPPAGQRVAVVREQAAQVPMRQVAVPSHLLAVRVADPRGEEIQFHRRKARGRAGPR